MSNNGKSDEATPDSVVKQEAPIAEGEAATSSSSKRPVSVAVNQQDKPDAKRIKVEPITATTAPTITASTTTTTMTDATNGQAGSSVTAAPANVAQQPIPVAVSTALGTQPIVAATTTNCISEPGSGSTAMTINEGSTAPPKDSVTGNGTSVSATASSSGTSEHNAAGEQKNTTDAGAAAAAAAAVKQEQKETTPSVTSNVPASSEEPLPLKALKMSHLRTKYTGELEYMLREFRKLERQLLGAKGATQIEESAGSRERREKLHSFILHLEDTIRQIELGCKLEAEGKSTVNVGVGGPGTGGGNRGSDQVSEEEAKRNRADSVALSNLTQEKDEEENVQKLEEHILANLLPVKVRLKKQLAAQQGATRNPAGMPAQRRGMLQPSDPDRGKGTFAAAAEQRRKEAEALAAAQQQRPAEPVHPDKTQFGKPLGRRGSSLTQKLHGQTLGSTGRVHGHGVGVSKLSTEGDTDSSGRKVSHGGVAPGSNHVSSGVAAATTSTDTPQIVKDKVMAAEKPIMAAPKPQSAPPKTAATTISATVKKAASEKSKGVSHPKTVGSSVQAEPKSAPLQITPGTIHVSVPSATTKAIKEKLEDPTLTEEERKKLRRKLKKKLLLSRARRREYERQRLAALQHTAQVQGPAKAGGGRKKANGGKVNGKKRGPRSVEYICALCSEAYSSVCDYNPWWALAQHECPKCRKTQIPRIDISAPANAIEYHPALLAHAEDNAGSAAATTSATAAEQPEGSSNSMQVNATQPTSSSPYPASLHTVSAEMLYGSDSEFGSDLSDITDGNLSDISLDSDDSGADVFASMAPAEKAEYERFGFEYKGPKLSESEASRLLILMLHANGCPCQHKNPKHKDVCKSTKYMMLHVRDCPGTTSTFDVCPFPWCRKVKHLLFHLVSCTDPDKCAICSPSDLTKEMKDLVGLNEYRLKRQRERMVASFNASTAARQQLPPAPKPSTVTSSKKPCLQVPSNGITSSKPKASASRAKARSTTQPVAKTTKSATPAANITSTTQKQAVVPASVHVPVLQSTPATSDNPNSSQDQASTKTTPPISAAEKPRAALPLAPPSTEVINASSSARPLVQTAAQPQNTSLFSAQPQNTSLSSDPKTSVAAAAAAAASSQATPSSTQQDGPCGVVPVSAGTESAGTEETSTSEPTQGGENERVTLVGTVAVDATGESVSASLETAGNTEVQATPAPEKSLPVAEIKHEDGVSSELNSAPAPGAFAVGDDASLKPGDSHVQESKNSLVSKAESETAKNSFPSTDNATKPTSNTPQAVVATTQEGKEGENKGVEPEDNKETGAKSSCSLQLVPAPTPVQDGKAASSPIPQGVASSCSKEDITKPPKEPIKLC